MNSFSIRDILNIPEAEVKGSRDKEFTQVQTPTKDSTQGQNISKTVNIRYSQGQEDSSHPSKHNYLFIIYFLSWLNCLHVFHISKLLSRIGNIPFSLSNGNSYVTSASPVTSV